jgi:hypothetical protein
MTRLFFILFFIFINATIFSACVPTKNQTNIPSESTVSGELDNIATDSSTIEQFKPFSARFEIYTKGTKRIFTSSMYHKQSPSVFIQADDPSRIYVTQNNIHWNDFFETLPFSLNKECLVTGTKQTFCSNEEYQLVFVLNGVEEPKALDLLIKQDDFLIIKYVKK